MNVMINDFNFTGIEPIIEWLVDTGLMDVLSDMITDFSVEALYAVLLILVGLITSAAAWSVILIGLALIAAVLIIGWLIMYIVHSIGLMRIAKKLGVKHRWMAWIPFANIYLLGACAEKSETRNGRKPWKWGLILLFVTLGTTVGQPIVQLAVAIVLSVLPMLSVVINLILECSTLILLGMNAYCLYLIFKEFLGKTGGIVMAVCSTASIWFEGIFLFIVACFKVRNAQTPAAKEDVAVVIEAE